MNQTKNFLKASFWGGIAFGTVMGSFTLMMTASLVCGMGIGIVFGLLFGLIMFVFGIMKNRSFKKKI